MSRTGHKKDANHAEIVAALRQVGAVVLDVAQYAPELGVDLIVSWREATHYMEIKSDPNYYLTENESKLLDSLGNVGVAYNVVISVADALARIGAI